MDLAIMLPLLIAFGALIFFNSRRQKKAMQATINLHDSLQIGDRVHTTSGLLATIVDITDDNVDLEIAPGVVSTWMKLAVRDKIEPETDDDDDVLDEAPEASHATEITESTARAPLSSDPDRLTKD
jgi:preprotein translocase subunit YajC